ncbi:SMP-30/gluconolactonase/LRE family protein [Denitrobaculum tricleocarpae]|uniref:SMP-30/gluconolactonase/LRE family protein n=1 Tax=Denitrobaculum tricleocarpae TaxID=2591009 RepID=A0A545TMF9_9PROT|nr:SMP-30/gluconolactonase/LRE family protein [Denitrobaculum tricleocarpae]TQV78394.1 SMP-30/gluconolactonase/LRE family protein [Denitrobaculum tricleocarpae]
MSESIYEILDERFRRSVKLTEKLDCLWSEGRWTEGPVYVPAYRSVIWSDIPNDRRLRWDELTGAVGVFHGNAGTYTNGATLDRQGRIVACEHGTRRVVRWEHDGSCSVLADRYDGKRLNSPNDVVEKSDGSIWFTDPAYGIESDYEGFQADAEQDGEHVYRIDAQSGEVVRVADDLTCPNGLAFSLDERQLYIADSGGTRYASGEHHIRVFDVSEDGRLAGGRVFALCSNGFFDGFRLDTKGRIWTSAGDGVHCYDPDGSLIGKILVPERVSNLCFGGLKRNRLFITASASLYSVLLPTSGAKLL